ncbi:MAG: transcriptional regulator GcvA [Lonepinella koalarum]|nr:transcriptional regulator GcvA [Lonepinella koalarum]
MYKRLPPLNSLKAFESAARHLSFTKAADELFVTQAAVSHQIKLLEDFLGIPLFKRKNRALELTEQGSQYFIQIADILHKLIDVTSQLRENRKPYLTISVPQTFGIHWLVPRLSRFNEQYPDIDVRIKGVDQDEGLLNDEIDIAVYYGNGKWEHVQVEFLSKAPLLILASPKLLAKKPIHVADDLRNSGLIHIHTRDNWQKMAKHLQLSGLDIQHGPLFSHTFMGLQAAIHGQGVILANAVLAEQEIKNGNLQIVLPTDLPDPKAFYVVNNPNQENNQPILAFRQWIINEMKKEE